MLLFQKPAGRGWGVVLDSRELKPDKKYAKNNNNNNNSVFLEQFLQHKFHLRFSLSSFCLIPDEKKAEGNDVRGMQALTSWELYTHCWVLGLRFSGCFIARQGQLRLFYTKEFQRIIICFFSGD